MFNYDLFLAVSLSEESWTAHRVFIFIVGIQFWHICFTPPYLSLFFSVSLLLSLTSPIYLSLSYPPHRLNSLKWKEKKGGKEGEIEVRRGWDRETERERRWSETDVPKLYTYNIYELFVMYVSFNLSIYLFLYLLL